MEVARIIDIWQVLLQEPRVAREDALILLQGELQQKVLNDSLEQKRRVIQKQIQKSDKSESQNRIKDSGRRAPQFMAYKRDKKKPKPKSTGKKETTQKNGEHTVDIVA